MDSEKSAEELTGMELDQAVVRVKYPAAYSEKSPIYGWRIFSETPRHPYSTARLNPNEQDGTEPEAWANAADKVIEVEYEFRTDNTVYRPWLYCRKNHEDMWVVWFATRPLALEAAKRDYVQRNTHPTAPKATEEPVQSDERVLIWVPGEITSVREAVEAADRDGIHVSPQLRAIAASAKSEEQSAICGICEKPFVQCKCEPDNPLPTKWVSVPAQGDGELIAAIKQECYRIKQDHMGEMKTQYEYKLAAAQERISELVSAANEAFIVMAGKEGTNAPFNAERWSRAVDGLDAALRTYADAKGEGK